MPVLHDVVITGWGIVAPIGIGADAVCASVDACRSGVRAVPEFVEAGLPIYIAGDVADFDPKEYVKPRKSLKVMSRETQLGFAAAEMAWRHAKLDGANIDPDRLGVTLGSNMFCPEVPELAAACHASDGGGGRFDFARWGKEGLREVPPLWLLKYLPNMVPAHIGIAHDARGPSNSIVAGDISALLAIIEAADVVARGHADVMVTGGTSSMIDWMDLLWHAGARLSRRVEEPERASRPFDSQRDGIVGGEGAAIFVLETEQHAKARGVQPLSRVLSFGRRHESAAESYQPTGRGIELAIEAALEMAGASAADIGHVNAHGLSTDIDDRIEAAAIRKTLGSVPVTAPKSYFGNLGAASGAVELAISLLAIDRGVIPPTINYETPDPDCPVNVITKPTTTRAKTIMALNHRTTGQAVALFVEAIN
jgi:3-oxoacyl-[acyl-carrier-protein] synthase II